MRAYLVITIHWIDDDWYPEKSVLDFVYFTRPHNPTTTCSLIFMCSSHLICASNLHRSTLTAVPKWHPLCDNFAMSSKKGTRCWVMIGTWVSCDTSWKTVKKHLPLKLANDANFGATSSFHEQLKPLQIALGLLLKEKIEVPSLEIETRWKSMFLMVKSCVKHGNVFYDLCNAPENVHSLEQLSLSTSEWLMMCHICMLSEKAFRFTRPASGQTYVTVSFLQLI